MILPNPTHSTTTRCTSHQDVAGSMGDTASSGLHPPGALSRTGRPPRSARPRVGWHQQQQQRMFIVCASPRPQPLARRCQPEPVLRAGDELWRWNDAGGSYQIALEEPRIIKIVQARHSSRSALSSTTAATWWWLGRGARWPCRAEIEDSDKAILLYLVARVTYIISQ